MDALRLTSRRRRQLHSLLRTTKEARVVRRALALLELDRGRPVAHVAALLGVTRQTLYNWVERFTMDGGPLDLRDRDGRGRPTVLSEPQRRFLAWNLN
jgi:transposase